MFEVEFLYLNPTDMVASDKYSEKTQAILYRGNIVAEKAWPTPQTFHFCGAVDAVSDFGKTKGLVLPNLHENTIFVFNENYVPVKDDFKDCGKAASYTFNIFETLVN